MATILITGSSDGIGRHTAAALTQAGLVMTARQNEGVASAGWREIWWEVQAQPFLRETQEPRLTCWNAV